MKIAVSPIKPFLPTQGICYLVRVDKDSDLWIEYIVDIVPLPPHLYCLFTDRYKPSVIKQTFFMVSFYTLDALFSGGSLYAPEPRMRYGKEELDEMLLKGIGRAIAAFMQQREACALIAFPARPGLARMYHQLLSAHAQSSGCRYIKHYKEEGIYVIEKEPGEAKSRAWPLT
ncbi:hypothetical protein [Kalamiella sp. sgz302252]|uniref:hypothetical protein n=1 Tax=Pantoea sp. sgz302252 TaxID=3341827 RepID=UPI0036D3DD93